jgi:hypothetical protein
MFNHDNQLNKPMAFALARIESLINELPLSTISFCAVMTPAIINTGTDSYLPISKLDR